MARFIGFVNASYPTSGSYTNSERALPFAYYCNHDGNRLGGIEVFEGGSNKGYFGAYSATTVLEIRLFPSGQVDYVKDGGIIYTSSTNNTQWPLYVGAALYHQAASTLTNVQYTSLPT